MTGWFPELVSVVTDAHEEYAQDEARFFVPTKDLMMPEDGKPPGYDEVTSGHDFPDQSEKIIALWNKYSQVLGYRPMGKSNDLPPATHRLIPNLQTVANEPHGLYLELVCLLPRKHITYVPMICPYIIIYIVYYINYTT